MIVPAGGASYEAPSLSDDIPRGIGSMPVSSVADLGRYLAYRPLADDFWIPIPTRSALARFLLEEPTRLDLRPTDDRRFGPEHHMAGLLHGIRLREYMIEELDAMSYASMWRQMLGLDRINWFVKCQVATGLLRRDIRDLKNQHVFHSYDVRRKNYSSCLTREMEQNWDWACETAARSLGGTTDCGTRNIIAL
ncbi:hypothetical protein HRG_008279 [Hirsutella rhossiliensis]|uniref:Uncharacterized protein n=1 Tax=Hirsutella rhossiliensis TaxID=111463 RepID=A0A9P8SFU5_9HYPO|nr:uncharacterized protein HRG_08279 [Hirsutella rhossiliensis]KAH0961126.1 hypothetical protein HRG_08279 [Hirsutella rhossiliensis]